MVQCDHEIAEHGTDIVQISTIATGYSKGGEHYHWANHYPLDNSINFVIITFLLIIMTIKNM